MADARQFAKLDLGYFDNPKVADFVEDRPRVLILHLRAILYCRQHLTDGKFPIRLVCRMVSATYCGGQCDGQCDYCAAVDMALFDRDTDRQGRVHDYLEHQQSAEDVQKLSNAGKKGAAARWASDSHADGKSDGTAKGGAKANAERGEERRGDLTLIDASGAADTDPRFDEWWDTYGNKTGKAKSKQKYLSIVKAKKATPDQLITATNAYIAHLKAEGKYPQFQKDPLTWLNGEHWEDELTPAVGQHVNRGWWEQ